MNMFVKVLKQVYENKKEKVQKDKGTKLTTDWLNSSKENYNPTVIKTEN